MVVVKVGCHDAAKEWAPKLNPPQDLRADLEASLLRLRCGGCVFPRPFNWRLGVWAFGRLGDIPVNSFWSDRRKFCPLRFGFVFVSIAVGAAGACEVDSSIPRAHESIHTDHRACCLPPALD